MTTTAITPRKSLRLSRLRGPSSTAASCSRSSSPTFIRARSTSPTSWPERSRAPTSRASPRSIRPVRSPSPGDRQARGRPAPGGSAGHARRLGAGASRRRRACRLVLAAGGSRAHDRRGRCRFRAFAHRGATAMNLHEGVPLSKYTTLGTGGAAHRLGNPGTADELVEVLAWWREKELPVAAVGLGSNLLAADEGYAGLVVKLGGELASAHVEDGRLLAGGGAPLAVCLHRARAADLGGLEFVCAIPGTVGGGVKMNAGAYGGDIASILVRAQVADADGADWRSPEELGLSYRRSLLEPGQVVAAA